MTKNNDEDHFFSKELRDKMAPFGNMTPEEALSSMDFLKTLLIIDCISDLHGFYPKLEGGDLLIVAGDLTARDEIRQYVHFTDWLSIQPYKLKIVIGGNHDGHTDFFYPPKHKDMIYLQDSGTEFEGLKIWGSPWTPPFCNWHFMLPPEEIKEKWDLIPGDTDILITHGPPYGVLDKVDISSKGDKFKHAGCKELMKQVVGGRLSLKLHVFGHVHEGYGMVKFEKDNTIFVNASHVNQDYKPVNKPIRIEL